MAYRVLLLAAASLFLVLPRLFAQNAPVPVSNVAGKKLIRVAQELIDHTPATDVPGKVRAWQETGYDGLCFCLSIDPEVSPPAPNVSDSYKYNMLFRWWDVDPRSREEFERDVRAFKAVADWGRLTDNFLWVASHAKGHKPPDWASDADWDIVLANARLAARIAKDIGFKGILFDPEGYGNAAFGVWRQPWDYPLYARSDYVFEKRTAPRPFGEVASIVRRRGREYAQALCTEYPDVVLAAIGLYEGAWGRLVDKASLKGDLAKCRMGLWPAFIDGLLEGLDERASLVSFCGGTYLDSQYRNFLVFRDYTKEQSLVLSSVPDLARRRITFAAGIWTDAGFGGGAARFSNTDPRVNQRDPERHMHAVHNALAASDRYAWQWGEWGKDGESNFTTADPTPLMRRYWQANIEAHQPHDLAWEPQPHLDLADYTVADADARERDEAFWKDMQEQGYSVAVSLPEYWKFRIDPEMLVRFRDYMSPDYSDDSWLAVKPTSCWQSQGFRANEIGLYRVSFTAPPDLDPEKQEIVLAFGGLGSGQGHVYVNGGWISFLVNVVDVSELIKPGEINLVGIVFDNKSGPGGLMGRVNLLVRDRDA